MTLCCVVPAGYASARVFPQTLHHTHDHKFVQGKAKAAGIQDTKGRETQVPGKLCECRVGRSICILMTNRDDQPLFFSATLHMLVAQCVCGFQSEQHTTLALTTAVPQQVQNR